MHIFIPNSWQASRKSWAWTVCPGQSVGKWALCTWCKSQSPKHSPSWLLPCWHQSSPWGLRGVPLWQWSPLQRRFYMVSLQGETSGTDHRLPLQAGCCHTSGTARTSSSAQLGSWSPPVWSSCTIQTASVCSRVGRSTCCLFGSRWPGQDEVLSLAQGI